MKKQGATTSTSTSQIMKRQEAAKFQLQPIPKNKNKSITLCLSCGDMQQKEVYGTLSLDRMRLWQDYTSRFWGHYPYLFKLFKYADLFLLSLGIVAAFSTEYRDVSIYFAAASIIFYLLKEHIPLDPLPFNVYNVVTSRRDAYTTAAITMLVSFVYIGFVGVLLSISEQLGNFIHNDRTSYSDPPENIWTGKYLSWITLAMFVVPSIYFIALQVSTFFVQPQITKLKVRAWTWCV